MADDVEEVIPKRFQRRADRLQAMRAMAVKRVRVVPRDDGMRRVLRHPAGNTGFPEEGSVEWPLDQFTKRRLNDGSILRDTTAPEPEQQKTEPEKVEQYEQPERRAAAARRPTNPAS